MVKPVPDELRAAIARGDFAKAETLIPAYGQFAAALLGEAPTEADREQVMASFQDLLSLARVMRAHLAAKLNTTRRASHYILPAPAHHTIYFDA